MANSAQSLTCSPLSYQLATDTLRAKWGAPFNMLLLGEVTNIGRAFCGPLSDFNDMRSSVTLDGIDLNTGWKHSGLEVIAYYLNDKECDDKLAPKSFSLKLIAKIQCFSILYSRPLVDRQSGQVISNQLLKAALVVLNALCIGLTHKSCRRAILKCSTNKKYRPNLSKRRTTPSTHRLRIVIVQFALPHIGHQCGKPFNFNKRFCSE